MSRPRARSRAEVTGPAADLNIVIHLTKEPDWYAELEQIGRARVLGFDYRFVLITEREAAHAEEHGHMQEDPPALFIARGRSAQMLGNTVLHELLHACHTMMGLSNDSNEESFTHLTANALQAVWRDNPALMVWLTRIFQHG